MAKKSETVVTEQTEIKHKGTPFARLAPVTLPILKHADNTAVYVRFDGEMRTEPKMKGGVPLNDEQGNPATITTARVVDLTTGELMNYVVGAALKSELQRYAKGYVGVCFEIQKTPAAAGKRSKGYTIFEIADPSTV